MSNPFNLALKYLRDDLAVLRALDYRDDDPDVASCVAAIRVLEAARRFTAEDKERLGRIHRDNIRALLEALPDGGKGEPK